MRLLFLSLVSCTPQLKEGDIVFQISNSRQSNMIQIATNSIWSHCGIIIEKKDGLYVLEASNVVKLTKFEDWKKRGRFSLIKSKRIIDTPIKIEYEKYLGIPYDLQFKLNNSKYYCSELVWEIYKNQFGVELCIPKPIKDFNISLFKEEIESRNIDIDQLAIAPCDL